MKLAKLITCILLAGAISACSSVSQHSSSRTYQCGIQQITVTTTTDNAILSLRGGQEELMPVVSASGAKFQSADERTEYWNKGPQARVTWQGEQLPLCVEQGHLPTHIAFRGNEPFWLMTLNHQQLTYTTPTKEQKLAVAARTALQDTQAWRLPIENQQQPIGVLEVAETICYDSMSGKAYPYTVTLTLNGNTVDGCGGETIQLLQGQPWQLTEGLVHSTPLTKPLSVQFLPDGKLKGYDGCNQFVGQYSVEGEIPRLNVVAKTKRGCAASTREIAQKFTNRLNNTVKIDIKESNIVLKVNNGQQLTFAPTY